MRFTSLTLALFATASLTSAAPASNADGNALQAQLNNVLRKFGLKPANGSSGPPGTAKNQVADAISRAKGLMGKIKSQRYKHSIKWKQFQGWNTFKANGVNLGSWLEIEINYTPDVIPAPFVDEWTWCEAVGKSVCGPVLEKHYASFITRADIDKLSKYGVNTLRIPVTYAAFYDVPGSQLYHGNQVDRLRDIAEYAISKYGMHIVLGLHSLPGGINWLQIGEAMTHIGWWYNSTNFDASMQVVSNALDFIKSTRNPSQYTFAPINEPCDDFSKFATAETVSQPKGVDYMMTYYNAVYEMMQQKGLKNTMMISDSFMGAAFWSPLFNKNQNIAIDSHFYFFAAQGVYATYTSAIACGQAAAAPLGVNFPIFVGEWSLQSFYNNTLALRKEIFDTSAYAWSNYMAGGTFWNVKYLGTDLVSSGEGGTKDYWSYMNLIDEGVILPGGEITGSYC